MIKKQHVIQTEVRRCASVIFDIVLLILWIVSAKGQKLNYAVIDISSTAFGKKGWICSVVE